MTKSTWGNMLNEKFAAPKDNFALHHLEHVGENPMYAEHTAQAFRPKPAKVKLTQPKAPQVGSPWHYLNGGN